MADLTNEEEFFDPPDFSVALACKSKYAYSNESYTAYACRKENQHFQRKNG